MMIRAVLLALSVAAMPAAEIAVRDLRLGVESRPSAFDYTFDSSTAHSSASDSFDGGMGIEAGGRWSFARLGDPWGVVVGADAIVDAWSYGGASSGLAAGWLRASAGPAWALSDRVTIGLEAGVQYGRSRLSLPATAAAPAFSASGAAFGYDARMTMTWLLTRRFGIGVNAGWLVIRHDLAGDADVRLDQSGWFAGLEAVWRFNDTPTRLE